MKWIPAAVLGLLTPLSGAGPVEGMYLVDAREFGTLYRVDAATGATVEIGELGMNILVGLAADPETNVLYAVGRNDSGWGLFEVDPSTGDTTFVPSGMAFGPAAPGDSAFVIGSNGNTYKIRGNGGNPETLLRYNLNTGESEFVSLILSGNNGYAGAYNPLTDRVLMARRLFGQFYSVDATGNDFRTEFGTGPALIGSGGITFDPNGRLFGAAITGGGIYEIDADNGDIIGVMASDAPSIYALTYLVPSPGSLVPILVVGVLGAGRRARG